MYHKWKNKREWVKSLKVGDVVCDCRCRHLRIKKLCPEIYPPSWARRLGRKLELFLPEFVVDKFLDFTEWLFPYFWDYQIELEDGAFCSGINCCSYPYDHKEQIK